MQIVWQPKAIKQLKKLGNQQASERIVQAVKSLADYPTVSGLKALTHHEYTHRLRVGEYRVLLNIHQEIEITNVEEVKKRDERTY